MMFDDHHKKKKLLQEIASLLTIEKAVEHPCNVALAKYNFAEKEIKYDTLFSDWNLTPCHYSFPAMEFEARVRSFVKMTNEINEKPSHAKAWRIAEKNVQNREEFLLSVASELRETVFHLPVTDVLYEEAREKKKMWSGGSLQAHNRYQNYGAERHQIEQEKKHVGHWKYGCSLEILYLCADIHNHYGTYFIKRERDEMLLVTVFCRSASELRKFGAVLNKHAKKYKFQKRKLYAEDTDAPEMRAAVTSKKKCILSYLKERIPRTEWNLRDRFVNMQKFYKNSDDGTKITAMYKYVKSEKPSNLQLVEYYEKHDGGAKG